MDAVSIDKPKVCEKIPDLAIWFSDRKEGITYYIVNLWVDENALVIETDGEQPKYKLIDGSKALELKKILKRYKAKTYNE